MDTLNELKYYCNEDNFIGALMISGEWGSGKTYLIENILKPELENTHIILRISLFGLSSVEEVHKEIKKNWLQAYCELKELIHGLTNNAKKMHEDFSPLLKNLMNFLPDATKSNINKYLAINVLDFVKINNKIDTKKVVIVFDDLVRSNISTIQLLGCINYYCENLHINTIVIANEDKFTSNPNVYEEIKEKTIQRTILYNPDYSKIVTSVIESFENDKYESYCGFMKERISDIINLFSESVINETKEDSCFESLFENSDNSKKKNKMTLTKSHNIRALKCAISDFERIYNLLIKKESTFIDRCFFSFISYSICFKTGKIVDSEKENEVVSNTYFDFYDANYITKGMKKWIKTGEWNFNDINEELSFINEREKAITPKEKIRLYDIFQLEENDIHDGFNDFLGEAYNGTLDLNDYVNFIINCSMARQYKIAIPDINWNLINKGIEKRIEKAFKTSESKPNLKYTIDEIDRNNYSNDEWTAYEKIHEFYESDKLEFDNNIKKYGKLMSDDPKYVFSNFHFTDFNVFNDEMAKATINGFRNSPNKDKRKFIENFNRFWKSVFMNDYENKFDYQSSLGGFNSLEKEIINFKEECITNLQTISAAHATRFLEILNCIISQLMITIENCS